MRGAAACRPQRLQTQFNRIASGGVREFVDEAFHSECILE
jgi:hypothetical protein